MVVSKAIIFSFSTRVLGGSNESTRFQNDLVNNNRPN
jgi:hypothetical protein